MLYSAAEFKNMACGCLVIEAIILVPGKTYSGSADRRKRIGASIGHAQLVDAVFSTRCGTLMDYTKTWDSEYMCRGGEYWKTLV